MSVFARGKKKTFDYDFWVAGRRYTGGTGKANRREALAVEAELRRRAETEIAAEKSAGAGGPLTLQAAIARYWTEIGQHHAASTTTLRDLNRLQDYLGDHTRLTDITDDDVAKLIAWRRAQTVKGRDNSQRLAPATVNRSTLEPLQKLFNRARKVWRVPLPNEPDWKLHTLAEPTERVREVRAHEDALLWAAIRPDYHAVIHFALEAGLRMDNCLLRRDQVDLAGGVIRVRGKGGKPIAKAITPAMRAILMTEMANPTPYVFTYAAKRGDVGERHPITASGLKTVWRRARAKGLPADLRFHDLRHDFATKLLRETRNLKLVSKALDHSKIETTMRYAHVLDEEVSEGMQASSERRAKRRKGSV